MMQNTDHLEEEILRIVQKQLWHVSLKMMLNELTIWETKARERGGRLGPQSLDANNETNLAELAERKFIGKPIWNP